MAIEFEVFTKQYPDNLSDADLQTALKTDLDALEVTTVYSIEVEHLHGFWVVFAVYA
jgi:hypothetical protein